MGEHASSFVRNSDRALVPASCRHVRTWKLVCSQRPLRSHPLEGGFDVVETDPERTAHRGPRRAWSPDAPEGDLLKLKHPTFPPPEGDGAFAADAHLRASTSQRAVLPSKHLEWHWKIGEEPRSTCMHERRESNHARTPDDARSRWAAPPPAWTVGDSVRGSTRQPNLGRLQAR